jgi:UDP-glucose 4-epimerase
MKIFVTGGTGFIGRNLVEQLSRIYEIHAPTSKELNLLDEDKVYDYLVMHKFDIVIHAATWNATRNSPKDLMKVLPNNLRMFLNITRCSHHFGKMIYYGSGSEYDRRHWIPRMKEVYFDAHVPAGDYGFSKYIMRKYTEAVENIYNLCLFGIFGKYEDWEIRFISNVCCKAIHDLPITIKQNVFFDYLYIDDLMKISGWFIKNEPREKVYNICTGNTYDLLTLAKKILNISGKNLEVVIIQEGLGREYSGDNSKLLQEIGVYKFQDIDDSLYELYHWYLTHKEYITPEKLFMDK